jgi:hypothetical protein
LRGWSREGGQERVVKRGWSREGGQERVVKRRWSREGGQERVAKREWSREGGQERVVENEKVHNHYHDRIAVAGGSPVSAECLPAIVSTIAFQTAAHRVIEEN